MIDVAEKTFSFGDFQLNCAKRLLLKNGKPVALNSKTYDLLSTLVENRGQIVSKNDLLDTVWEGQFVEENNLTVQISTLRKLLGEKKDTHQFIATVPGKGYSFVADITQPETELIVESHEYSRITFEEVLPTNGNAAKPATLTGVSRPRFNWRFAMLGLVAVVTVAVLGGGLYYLRSGGPNPKNSFYESPTVKQLTTSGKVGMAALSPDGKLFAYTIDDLGQKSLWVGYIEGGNHIQLKEPAEEVYRSLTFSPDNKLLFYSLRDEKNPKPKLMKMPVLGGLQEKVLDDVSAFSLSPDGKEIALTRPDPKDETKISVSIASLDGKAKRDLVSFDRSQRFIAPTLSWSRDKTKLATALINDDEHFRTDLAIIDVASGNVEMVNTPVLREITKAAWLGDGRAVIVTAIELESHSSVPQYRIFQIDYPSGEVHKITSDRSQYGESWHSDAGVSLSIADAANAMIAVEHRQSNNIWIANASNLADQRQITFGSFGKYDGLWGLDWTPDGKLIYTTSDTESQFIAQMNADGGDQKQVTASGKVDSSLSVTADGKYIVFHSNRASEFAIWRTDIDGSNAKQITFEKHAFVPTPSPDGRWVYYKSYTGKKNGFLCRVPIDGGEEECFTEKETSQASFSPDGRFIAAAYRTDKLRIAIFSADDHRIVRQIDMPKHASSFIGIRWTADSSAFTLRDIFRGYWMFPVEGEPYKLEGLPDERLYNFSWSRDGKWLAFVRGHEIRDIVLIKQVPSDK